MHSIQVYNAQQFEFLSCLLKKSLLKMSKMNDFLYSVRCMYEMIVHTAIHSMRVVEATH